MGNRKRHTFVGESMKERALSMPGGSTKQNVAADRRANRMILARTMFLLVLCGVVMFIPLIMQLYKIQIKEHDFYEQEQLASRQGTP